MKKYGQQEWLKFTSQINVYLSCHFAFFGKNIFEHTLAMSPTATTPPREYAEVFVNMVGVSAISK